MRISIIFVLILSLFLTTHSAFSQGTGRKLYPGATRTRSAGKSPIFRKIAYPWTYSIGVGRTSYMGTLCPNGDCLFSFNALNIQLNAGLSYRLNSRFSVGGTIRYLRISGSDADFGTIESGRLQRNLSFFTDGLEIMAVGRFDILPLINKFLGEKSDQYNRRQTLVPYVFGGIGFLLYSPKAKNADGENVALRPLITSREKEDGSTYSPISPVLMAGVGAQLKLTEYLDLGFDLSLSKPFSQYLDDIGSNSKYPTWNNNQGAAPNAESWYFADRADQLPGGVRIDVSGTNPTANDFRGGNPSNRGRERSQDYYFMFNIKLMYTVSHALKPWDPSHKHFRGGKGSKHHSFDKR